MCRNSRQRKNRTESVKILKSTDGNPPELLDPFAGGGAIPLEAQRLGLKAHAQTVHMQQTWSGARGLAEDVRYYGQWMKREAFKQIKSS